MRICCRSISILFAVAVSLGGSFVLHAAEVLLVGEVVGESDARMAFSLSGNSRTDVVGGTILLGEAEYEITHVSAHNLIGGKREHEGKTEFVIFSSSFSPVTAAGQPWVAGQQYFACDQQYNSFLARYSVADNVDQLPDVPFKHLADSVSTSESSSVFCFVSAPEGR